MASVSVLKTTGLGLNTAVAVTVSAELATAPSLTPFLTRQQLTLTVLKVSGEAVTAAAVSPLG